MDSKRALVAPASSQLLDRSRIEVERSLGPRVGRALLVVTVGTGAGIATALVSPMVGALVVLASLVGPPLVFLARRIRRFVRAGFAATGAFRLAKHAVSTRVAETAEGQWVRVRGHVLPGPSFTSAGGRPQAVLAGYLGTLGGLRMGGAGHRELHGVDFTLASPAGDFVRVRVAGARYLDQPRVVPRRWFEERPLHVHFVDDSRRDVASVYREDIVAVGDEVEVLGFLRREIDAGAESGFRGARPTLVLAARSPWALLVRRP